MVREKFIIYNHYYNRLFLIMATYLELKQLDSNHELKSKVAMAVTIAADNIRQDVSASAAEKAWAAKAFESPDSEVNRFLSAVIAANNSAAIGNITGASDTQIQTNVNDVVSMFVDADAGI